MKPSYKRKRIKVQLSTEDEHFKVRLPAWVFTEPLTGMTLAAHYQVYVAQDNSVQVSNRHWCVTEVNSGMFVTNRAESRGQAVERALTRIEERVRIDGGVTNVIDTIFFAATKTSDYEVRYEFD